MSAAVQEDLAGVAVVKQYALEPLRHAAFRGRTRTTSTARCRLVRARGTLGPLFAMFGGVGTLIVLWVGGREVIHGRLSVGGLVAFNAYLVALSWPTIALGWIISMWQRGMVGWERVRDAAGHGAAGSPTPPRLRPARRRRSAAPSIEVRELTVERDGRRSWTASRSACRRAATLAIVGPTGVGQDHAGRRAPAAARRPARHASSSAGATSPRSRCRALRALIGYAPQEAFLFSATIAENIGFVPDRAGAGSKRRREAAGLPRDIAAFPDGYDTVVGERGITLSGGQRQRVALARALAADPRILILDDSLSSVDAETEREILTHLRPILAGRTSILVSHRVAAVKDAAQILVLDGGRIAERGTHASCWPRAASTRRSTGRNRPPRRWRGPREARARRPTRRAARRPTRSWARRSTARCCGGSSPTSGRTASSASRCAAADRVAVEIAQPYLLKKAIDEHIARGRGAGLDRLGLFYLLALVGQYGASFAQTYLTQLVGQRAMNDLRLACTSTCCRWRRRSSTARRSAAS